MPPTQRQSHAALDRESRLRKARKIAELVEPHVALRGARVLDVGAGAGYIAAAFAELVGPEGEVRAVDVNDERVVTDGYRFTRVDGTTLPFADETFDVVLSNHVIEHVGGEAEQVEHLRELYRVLAPRGVAYLATPNKWVVVEPHFKLPFLSWIPERLRTPYVRAARRGSYYDCDLATRAELRRLARDAGFDAQEVTIDAMRVLARVEDPPAPVRRALEAPEALLRTLLPVIPTMVFSLKKSA